MSQSRQALALGRVSPEQADVIVRSIEALPSGELVRRRGEAELLRHAAALDASELARAGRHLARVVDPDGADHRLEQELEREERAAHADRYLSIVADRMGGVRVRGRGTAEDGALLRAALLPLTSPEPVLDETTADRVYDPRDHGARCWDALIAAARHCLGTDLVPDSHGTRPRLAVTLDHEALKTGLAGRDVPTSEDGFELSVAAVRRLACDADLIPAVLGTRGEVLDVGRLRRLVTPVIWTAVVLRDRHCAFPGCSRPPVMCHAHHIVHWVDGGTTKLDNLVLLCGHHHRVLHDSP
jgi:hypothetical protein